MPIAALALVLTAAVFHASYNFLAKSSRDTTIFLWWSVVLGAALYAAWLFSSGLGFALGAASLPFFLLSGVAELGYFYGLVRGYAQGDLSLVYPLSRGSAPLFVTLWSALVIGERLPLLGYAGIGLMIAGVYIASLTANGGATSRGKVAQEENSMVPRDDMTKDGNFSVGMLLAPLHNHAARWALASGVFIAIYSLSDSQAIKFTPPLVYNFWVNLGNVFTWALVVWRWHTPSEITGELRVNWKPIVAAAVMTIGAYALVLVAQTMTSTSYVVAGRGTSVVIGALLGTIVLKEGFGKVRVFSAAMMVVGLVMIAIG